MFYSPVCHVILILVCFSALICVVPSHWSALYPCVLSVHNPLPYLRVPDWSNQCICVSAPIGRIGVSACPLRLVGSVYLVCVCDLTFEGSRGQDVLVHVVQVVRDQQVLRGGGSQAQEGGVQVQDGRQRGQSGVADQGEARQDLDLLPAVELLPQGGGHLAQGLSGGTTRHMTTAGWSLRPGDNLIQSWPKSLDRICIHWIVKQA